MTGNEYVAGLVAPLSLYYESVNLATHYFGFGMKVGERFEILTHIPEVPLRIQIL